MSRFATALKSSIGSKLVMALTGLALLGFVIAHMVGNLQLFAGPEKLNAYAHTLQSLGPILWAMRLGLLAIFVLHVATAFRLWSANKAARGGQGYAMVRPSASTYASRTMIWSGFIVLAFVVYHLLHFTLGVTNPEHAQKTTLLDGEQVKDVYGMVTASFSVPAIALAYAAFQVVLFLHLSHGIQSFAQTLGINHGRYTPMIKKLSFVLAALIAGGNLVLATSVLTGLVKGAA